MYQGTISLTDDKTDSTIPRAMELIPATQSYEWGALAKDGSTVAKFATGLPGFSPDPEKPYAELWMGTHSSLPSLVLDDGKPLSEYLGKDSTLVGEQVSKRYGSETIPFLFKILAIRYALSIQAHPDKKLAVKLFMDSPKVYKDNNHKPEMAIALTEFSGFCGFMPLNEIADHLHNVPEFAQAIDKQIVDEFLNAVQNCSSNKSVSSSSIAANHADDLQKLKQALQKLFKGLMTSSNFVPHLQALVKRLNSSTNQSPLDKLVLKLNDQFPDDIGVFCAYMLNLVHLKPGQAMFLQANEPHAYISGDIVECMATSDNVVRAGLTPKFRDVSTLVSMLTYNYGPASGQIMSSEPWRSTRHSRVYDPPIDEFSVVAIDIPVGNDGQDNQLEIHPPVHGPSIIIVTDLKDKDKNSKKQKQIKWTYTKDASQTGTIQVNRVGQVIFISADTELNIQGGLTAYRAYVE